MSDRKTENLMDELLKEMNRAREVLKEYEQIPEGIFGAAMIKQSIQRAEKSISSGDVVQMLLAYNDLKSIE